MYSFVSNVILQDTTQLPAVHVLLPKTTESSWGYGFGEVFPIQLVATSAMQEHFEYGPMELEPK